MTTSYPPITSEEFYKKHHRGTKLSPESTAVLQLAPLTGIKIPCRWKHYGYTCSGINTLKDTAQRHNKRVLFSHRDKGFILVFCESKAQP